MQTILATSTDALKVRIKSTNVLLKSSEASEPYNLILLDEEFATENDSMNMDLSTDGVHLNEKGYLVWINKIKDLISAYVL